MFAPLALLQTKLLAVTQELILLTPNLIAGALLVAAVWWGGKVVGKVIARISAARGRPDLGALLGVLARVVLMGIALLVASALVFPSVNPGDIFAALGFISVAVGLAFKDILQNILAGLLLVIRRPYLRGDQIIVKGYEGTVEQVDSRATLLKTYDGRRVLVPNSDLYTTPVIVNTAFALHRNELQVRVQLATDLPAAITLFQKTVASVDGVVHEPAVEVIPWDIEHAQVDLKIRWWADARRLPQVQTKGRVILAVAAAAKAQGMVLPYPTSVVVLEDEGGAGDNVNAARRETKRQPPFA